MKLLFDQNISFRVLALIREHFPDCRSVKELNLWNKDDYSIWKFALSNNLCVVTFDEDFYNYNLVFESCPKIIWFRTGNISNRQVADALINNKEIIMAFLSGDMEVMNDCLEIDRISEL